MTISTDSYVVLTLQRTLLALAVVASVASAGCTSSALEEGVPPPRPGATGVPTNTGTYPNLNVAPKAAATQMTVEERDAKLAALRAAQQRQGPPGGSASSDAEKNRLKLIRNENGADTLKVIEGN